MNDICASFKKEIEDEYSQQQFDKFTSILEKYNPSNFKAGIDNNFFTFWIGGIEGRFDHTIKKYGQEVACHFTIECNSPNSVWKLQTVFEMLLQYTKQDNYISYHDRGTEFTVTVEM